jgi:ComF family protein
LYKHETFICNQCLLSLPKSNYHLRTSSELEYTFAGRVPVNKVMSLYLYQKCGRVQKLLYAIKYQEQKELGEYLGQLYSCDLAMDESIKAIDAVIPIPLHKNKLQARGYNQSEWFAKGLANGLSKPINNSLIERTTDTATQTKKKKFQRWENVEGIFKLKNYQDFANKHILLVDDVITTGATIEAAWLSLKEIEGLKISVASIAFAAKES